MITKAQLINIGFRQDDDSDRFDLYSGDGHIELSGSDTLGNHEPIPPGTYMLTADMGYIHLSKPFNDISEIEALINILT